MKTTETRNGMDFHTADPAGVPGGRVADVRFERTLYAWVLSSLRAGRFSVPGAGRSS